MRAEAAAILVQGGNRLSLVGGIEMPMPCAISFGDYVIEHLADDDVVLVIDETGFQAGQRVVRCGAAIHRFGSKIRTARSASSRPTFPQAMRSSIARCIFKGMDRRSRSSASHNVPAGTGFATKPKACDENDRTRDSRGCPSVVAAIRLTVSGDIEQQLRQAGKGYVLGVTALMCSDPGQARSVSGTAADIASDAASIRLKRLSEGTEPKDRGCMNGAISKTGDARCQPVQQRK